MLGAAATASQNRVGRAYVKPLFAQACQSLTNASALVLRACLWWQGYLPLRPPTMHNAFVASRPTVSAWTDAAGRSRWIAAVGALVGEDGDLTWRWSRLRLPDQIGSLLLDRQDRQTGCQAFLAVVLAYATFDLHDAMLLSFVDNDGLRGALLKGSSRAPEVNLGVGHLGMVMALMSIAMQAGRVQSKTPKPRARGAP